MEYKMDMDKLRTGFQNAENEEYESPFVTDGMQYILQHIVDPIARDVPLRFTDVDFDAFDEYEISEVIDNLQDEIAQRLPLMSRITRGFVCAKPQKTKSSMFF